ncbi:MULTISPECIES: virulence protein [Capnocytophaga]|uniref:Virulence protein-like protein n=1 Tax=Capnocytophaga ochracea (strain ATCC 27872 / DSM 7271 / CCUG 9716 / JCM 12966 / NCTC 12371 / SS31 / VPI 2845) TaxID=521097 RepID=C7M8G7_CAPOD|nr:MULTISPECIES: virulence protein [Capnocytophaga]ACU92337.1 Virulence protein-like protein [Capnocytophaga ochracea DSM 7271]NWO28947.1 virulence protein [Capnocytophaga sp. oral taxon 903]UAK51083.1 virulence protein [Capnocytophaga ochracea]
MENQKGEILFYQREDGSAQIDVRLEEDTVWLTQQLMAELFNTSKQNISLHIQNIFEEGELIPDSTVKKFLTVQKEGPRDVRRPSKAMEEVILESLKVLEKNTAKLLKK